MSVLLMEISLAGIVLHGKIRSDRWESNNYRNSLNYEKACKEFPMSLYGFYPVMAYDLRYDDQVPQQDRVKNLSIFVLNPSATLKLTSFNEAKNIYKFNLKLEGGDWLHYTGRGRGDGALFETGGTTLKGGGSLKLADGKPLEFIIEGKLEIVNDKLHWVSFNRNKYFDIKVETSFNCKNEISLIRLQDIPVIVSA